MEVTGSEDLGQVLDEAPALLYRLLLDMSQADARQFLLQVDVQPRCRGTSHVRPDNPLQAAEMHRHGDQCAEDGSGVAAYVHVELVRLRTELQEAVARDTQRVGAVPLNRRALDVRDRKPHTSIGIACFSCAGTEAIAAEEGGDARREPFIFVYAFRLCCIWHALSSWVEAVIEHGCTRG